MPEQREVIATPLFCDSRGPIQGSALPVCLKKKKRSDVYNRVNNLNTLVIENSIQHLLYDDAHDRIEIFLRETSHRVDNYTTYITQETGHYPG